MNDVRESDLIALGTMVLNAIALASQLGHESPAGSLDYYHGTDSNTYIFKDFIAWVSGREHLAEGCHERLLWLVEESGWASDMAESVMGISA